MTPANPCPSPSPLQVERLGNGLCCTLPKDANLPDVSNRLAHESSLYLRQHEANPVHWWPWCAEAFAEAKAKGKTIIEDAGEPATRGGNVIDLMAALRNSLKGSATGTKTPAAKKAPAKKAAPKKAAAKKKTAA